MRIAYVCRVYDPGTNDDEGAVEYALRALGHVVDRYDERRPLPRVEADVVLFNKWCDARALAELGDRGVVRAFWYWDLVDSSDPGLARRCRVRKEWMSTAIGFSDAGFCTDGDWVREVNSRVPGKLVWLTQGADARVTKEPPDGRVEQTVDVLFTGTDLPAQSARYEFVKKLVRRFGSRFVHVRDGLHGEELTRAYRRARVVVAPDSPVTDYYWSNRVYNVLGRGGYLLHPFSEGLNSEYGTDLDTYSSRHDLFGRIDHLLSSDSRAYRAGRAYDGWHATKTHHTYYHRCRVLVDTLAEKFPWLKT